MLKLTEPVELGKNDDGTPQIFAPDSLVEGYSKHLASEIYKSDFMPDGVLVILEGGRRCGEIMHKALSEYSENGIDYLELEASSYKNQNRSKHVRVSLPENIDIIFKKDYKTLIVDELLDTGNTFRKIEEELKSKFSSLKEKGQKGLYDSAGDFFKNLRTAVMFYKSAFCKLGEMDLLIGKEPNYFVKDRSEWIIFEREFPEIHSYTTKEQRDILKDYGYDESKYRNVEIINNK